jgi:hypothetical protein
MANNLTEQLFKTDVRITGESVPRFPLIEPTPAELTNLFVKVFEWPLQKQVDILEQVGRFVIVDYLPHAGYDPDVLLFLEDRPEAEEFHKAIRVYQDVRRLPVSTGPPQWMKMAEQAAKDYLVPAFEKLEPEADERMFVDDYVQQIINLGLSIQDGIFERTWVPSFSQRYFGHRGFRQEPLSPPLIERRKKRLVGYQSVKYVPAVYRGVPTDKLQGYFR